VVRSLSNGTKRGKHSWKLDIAPSGLPLAKQRKLFCKVFADALISSDIMHLFQ
jgi:hypothetical protein